MTTYRYDLVWEIDIDISGEQEAVLLQNGFVKNPKTGILEKYDIETEEYTYHDLVYEEEVEVEVLLSEYVSSRTVSVKYSELVKHINPVYLYRVTREDLIRYSATYITSGESVISKIFSFFKKALGIHKTEKDITEVRVAELRAMERSWKINSLMVSISSDWLVEERMTENEALEKSKEFSVRRMSNEILAQKEELQTTISSTDIDENDFSEFAVGKTIIEKKITENTEQLTDEEALTATKAGKRISFKRGNVGKKRVIEWRSGEKTVDSKEFERFIAGKRLISDQIRTETVTISKTLVDARKPIVESKKIYQPGVWSNGRNHDDGSLADFGATVRIKHMSGFSAFDPDYIDISEIRESVIKIINREHPSSYDIRKRKDEQDGFKIEKPFI